MRLLRLLTGSFCPSVRLVQLDFIFNCAAISVLKECEKFPEKALATNIPHALIEGLKHVKSTALFVHFSSDQVYPGDKTSLWTEDDKTAPVNAYGRSKLASEVFISEHLENYLIFRSSLICGPPLTLNRELFLQVRATHIVIFAFSHSAHDHIIRC